MMATDVVNATNFVSDHNEDGTTDVGQYSVSQETLNLTTSLMADGNGDGTADNLARQIATGDVQNDLVTATNSASADDTVYHLALGRVAAGVRHVFRCYQHGHVRASIWLANDRSPAYAGLYRDCDSRAGCSLRDT